MAVESLIKGGYIMSLFRVDYVIKEAEGPISNSATVSATSRYDAKKVLKRVINVTMADPADIEIKQVVQLEDINGKSCG
jgi:ribosomal protein S3AE